VSDTGRALFSRKGEESAFGRRWRRRFRRYTKGRIRTRIIQVVIFSVMLTVFLWVLHILSRYRPDSG
jgi:cell division septal protein FtsQ